MASSSGAEKSGERRAARAERRAETAESAERAAAAAAVAAAREARAAREEVQRLRAEGLELSRWRDAVLDLRDELKIARRRGEGEGRREDGGGGDGEGRRTAADDGECFDSPTVRKKDEQRLWSGLLTLLYCWEAQAERPGRFSLVGALSAPPFFFVAGFCLRGGS